MASYKVSLTNPCQENWDQMRVAQKGRHCNACAKTVVDFTLMTDTQIVDYFLKRTGENICGRFLSAQLETPVTPYVPVKRKISWYWNYFIGLLLLLTKTGSGKAQNNNVSIGYAGISNKSVQQPQPLKIKDAPVEDGRIRLHDKKTKPVYFGKGQVAEDNCSPQGKNLAAQIPGASVRSQSQAKLGAETMVRLGEAELTKQGQSAIYVLDGKIVANGNDINPDDIEEVTVLQPGAAVAIYGVQGCHGAIVIKLKSQKKTTAIKNKLVGNKVGSKIQ